MIGHIEAWSPSAYYAYNTCPRQFWLLYVAGRHLRSEHSPSSIRGQALHAGLAAGWAAFAEGSSVTEAGAAIEPAVEKLPLRAGVDPQEIEDWVEIAVRAFGRLGPHPADHVGGVEQEIVDEFDGVAVKARLDLLYNRAGVWCYRDWKTSTEMPRLRDVVRSTQLGVGAWLAARKHDVTRMRVAIASIGASVSAEVDMPRDMALAAVTRVASTARRADTDIEFAPRRGAACASCKVRAHCPLFAVGAPDPATYALRLETQ